MSKIIKQVDEVLKSGPPSRHTFFQLNFFVIGKEPTTQAKIHRCLEEMKSRRSALESIRMEIEEMTDKNALLALEMRKPVAQTEKDIIQRQIQRKIRATDHHIKELNDRIRWVEEELQFFLDAYQQLIQKEPQREWDDPDVQLEYWNAKLGQDIRSKLIMQQTIDTELLKTVLALPDHASIKKQVVGLIAQQKKLLENTRGQE